MVDGCGRLHVIIGEAIAQVRALESDCFLVQVMFDGLSTNEGTNVLKKDRFSISSFGCDVLKLCRAEMLNFGVTDSTSSHLK